ncbi:toprim domain-containing protein [Sulfuracidifex metallicus]|uniref:toprim domain-containing protein n=1 Tax=Sulfuracidifex metallicus TaxID=47303 RepID=UPI000AC6C248|nr:toprim domain-containing protein [Sulfuracidifex metallicus]
MKLVITEKPSVAMDIAKSLGKIERKDGYVVAGDYVVTWAYGHLLEIDDSIAPRKWSLEDLPIFPERFKYKV